MRVGFVGLGSMGNPIARNLRAAGHSLTVYNRSVEKTDALAAAGARVAAVPAEAARQAEVVCTMLADDDAVEAVVFGQDGLAAALPKGAIHISMSTISVALSRRLAQEHAARGQRYAAVPVFGRPEAAEARKLFVVAAGPADVLKECEPLFAAIGQRTFHFGEEPSAANVVKLSGNFLIASVMESLGEAFALTRKYGVDSQELLEMLTNSLFPAPAYKIYGRLIAENKFEPAGFKLTLGLKDVRLVLAAAEASAVPMPVASVIRDHFLEGIAQGQQEWDWSSIAAVVAKNAGL